MQTGELIRQARCDANITQAELAKRLGVTPQAISQYERGVKKPKIETITRIARALNTSPLFLVSDDDASVDIFIREKDALDALAFAVTIDELRAEKTSGIQSDKDLREKILEDRIIQFSKRYVVPAEILESDAPEYIDRFKKKCHQENDSISMLPKIQRRMIDILNSMNDNGQNVAVERVEELAQIPKYQRQPAGDTAQSVPDAEPNTDPTQK